MIAASVLEVFKRQAAHEFASRGNCRGIYRSTFKALLLLALGPSLVFLLYSPQLFAWVFGPEWRPAGDLARVLAPLCFFNFIASPLSYVFFVAGKQRMELGWQVVLLVMTVIVFAAPLPLYQTLAGYSIGRCLLYVVYLYMSYRCAANQPEVA